MTIQNKNLFDINDFFFSYKLIFWDFDGVIKDSVSVKGLAYKKTFEEFGEIKTSQIMEHHINNGGISRYKKIPLYLKWCNVDTNQKIISFYLERFSKYSIEAVINSKWIPGVKDILINFSKKKRNVLVTATPKKDILLILDKIQITDYFANIYGAEISKIDSIENELKLNKIKKEQSLFIGDSEVDLKAAINNQINFLLKLTKDNFALSKQYKVPFILDFSPDREIEINY